MPNLLIIITAYFLLITDVSAQSDVSSKRYIRNIETFKASVYAVNALKIINNAGSNSSAIKDKKSSWRMDIGTAFPINSEGYLLTINSVVDNANHVNVVDSSGKRYNAHIIGSDDSGKISVLKVDNLRSEKLPSTVSFSELQSPEEVFFLGITQGMSLSVKKGNISNLWHSDGIFEVESFVNPGTSGTLVFDKNENLIGILAFHINSENTSSVSEKKESRSGKKTYAVIPIEYATVLARSLIHCYEKDAGWIGLRVELHPEDSNSVIIREVVNNSPAYNAGIKPHDKIVEINNMPVNSLTELSEIITSKKAGETITIKIIRGDKTIRYEVILAAYPASGN